MLNLITKRAVKLLEILSIILSSQIFITQVGFSQNKKFDDSVALKKEIDSVLRKHGLKSTGFAINVISISQNGGQTAYSITNNYYSDPNYVPDSINFDFKINIENDKKVLCFYPKRGSWNNPFIAYDSVIGQKNIPISGLHDPLSFILTNNGKNIVLIGEKISFVCTRLTPLCLTLNKNENPIIVFGDYGYNERNYFYSNGKVTLIPLKEP